MDGEKMKESFFKAYDTIMSKLGIESFCIQWNHAYASDYKRHFHLVLNQTKLPINHATLELLPFPLRKFIIVNPDYRPHTKDYEVYINKNYTKFLVP